MSYNTNAMSNTNAMNNTANRNFAVVPGTSTAVPTGFEAFATCMSPGIDAVCYDTVITKHSQPIVKSWVTQRNVPRPMKHNISFESTTLPTQVINDTCCPAPTACAAAPCFAAAPVCGFGGCGTLY